MPPPAAPVADAQRIVTLDVLRGVAVLGILLVNISFFAFPFTDAMEWEWDQLTGADWVTRPVIHFVATGKFITIFSMLFGVGLALQSERARRAGRPFAALYSRRLLVLLAIGLGHGLLIWYGDILAFYAVIGFIALLCRKLTPRTLLIVSAILLMIPILGLTGCTLLDPQKDWGAMGLGQLLEESGTTGAEQESGANPDPTTTAATQTASAPASRPSTLPSTQPDTDTRCNRGIEMFIEFIQSETRVYQSGSWLEMLAIRAFYYLALLWPIYAVLWSWRTLALFLAGMAMIKLGLFDATAGRRRILRRMLLVGLVIGVPLEVLCVVLQGTGDRRAIMVLAQTSVDWFGTIGMALAYLSTVGLLCLDAAWVARLRPVAAVGQMALTNYLTHSIVCTTIFYSFGFGLFGRISHATGLLIVFAIFAVQLVVSPIWLRHFRFGPAEWAWRSLTYWRVQPMRRVPLPA